MIDIALVTYCRIRYIKFYLIKCTICNSTGLTLNVTAISSTSTSISLKWVATDDRVYYYSADISYSVLYFMNNISYVLTHDTEYITVTGLQPDTKYTFFIAAGIIDDDMLGPVGTVTYRTQAAGEQCPHTYSVSECSSTLFVGMVHFCFRTFSSI